MMLPMLLRSKTILRDAELTSRGCTQLRFLRDFLQIALPTEEQKRASIARAKKRDAEAALSKKKKKDLMQGGSSWITTLLTVDDRIQIIE